MDKFTTIYELHSVHSVELVSLAMDKVMGAWDTFNVCSSLHATVLFGRMRYTEAGIPLNY